MTTNTEAYEAVIGLEVHTHLLTRSKIFCGCSTTFGAGPNENVCPICMGMPGVLPVLNRRVVELAIRTGLAAHCTIAPYSIFDRKSYFYPDLPKGYQISQYETPICKGGYIDLPPAKNGDPRRVKLTRIHIEEDAGKNIHQEDASLVDFNRSGVPLIEIVSEPDLRSAEDAGAYLRQLREILQDLDASDGKMEEGSFRCDCNVSIRKRGAKEYGVRTEIKNLNSFRFVEAAIEYEIERQIEVVESGGKVAQETHLWDPVLEETRPMRSKEYANDYRYFPEPDLPPLIVPWQMEQEIRESMPELRSEKRKRYVREGLTVQEAANLTAERDISDRYDRIREATGLPPKIVYNWVMTTELRLMRESPELVSSQVAAVSGVALLMVNSGKISLNVANNVFPEAVKSGRDFKQTIVELDLALVSDEGAIAAAIDKVLAAEPAKLAEYRAGRDKLFGFFVGAVMKAMGGKANATVINQLLRAKLAG
jgi:aspartyl-tRNA(Asn)/glutamyl-tRNA(Gln) amidotransferase subunit B